MAANLTPQYLKAEAEYRRAATAADEVRWLEIMLREIPKHKASEKLQASLKQKLSQARKELEAERSGGKKGHGVRIPRQGAGTCVILGGPNAGKSSLLARVTRATPEIAPYPFTTRAPQVGMMPWEDCYVQLIDTPPITASFLEPYMQGLIRSADVALLMVDLGADEGIEQLQEAWEKLQATKTRLGVESRMDEDDVGVSYTQTILVPNKIDAPGADERLQLLHELCPLDLPEHVISVERGDGVQELTDQIFKALNVVRVYSKTPRAKEADFTRPFTLPAGGTVIEFAELIHKDFVDNFKFARVWSQGAHDGMVIKGDHVLRDQDVVELHQ